MTVFRIFSILFCLFCVLSLSGAHIVGGDVTYKCISSNPTTKTTKFTITFTMYRDGASGGAQFDVGARFGIFESNFGSNVWSHYKTIQANPSNIQIIPYIDECVLLPPNIIVERANYIFDVELPWSDKVYQITFQRCCRNNTINNLVNPGETGAAFYVEIFGNAIQECNNSPVFKNFPPVLICNQKQINFDHSAVDSEGDQIKYEFCAPVSAGGTQGATTPGNPNDCKGVTPLPSNCLPPFSQVSYNFPYDATNPMGGNPQISINPNDGKITGIPNILGQYVVGVCVNEFRNGVQIGSIRRDFQFNVVNCLGLSSTKIYDLCEGDSVLVNQTHYYHAGTYTQVFQTLSGCDSILNIIIKENKKSAANLHYKLCDDESVTVNGNLYNTAGIYTQLLTNKSGCDSTITISIEKYSKTESTINIQLCDGETGIVNNVTYDHSGTFTQILSNSNGCDSIISIDVKKGHSTFNEQIFSLCNQKPVTLNGQSYDSPGKFSQQFTSTSGCDSTLQIIILPCDQSILYDLEKCDALTPDKSMMYEEFLPTYINGLECGKIIASNIYRNHPQMNKHSCTPGVNNSKAMCVSASPSCDTQAATVLPITFELKFSPIEGYKIRFNHLVFQQNSPLNYNWIAGSNGPNNYPTKYSIKIFKNNTEVYSKSDIPTSNTWTSEKYDFFDNDDFTSDDSVSYRVELLPYCVVGNTATVSVWDIDDVSLYFSCEETTSRKLSGQIINMNDEISSIEVRRQYQNAQISTKTFSDGTFSLPHNRMDKAYEIAGYYNQNTIYNVTTLDLVVTQRHILGLESFTSPLQYLAADVNADKKVTAADLVQMRKIILGVDEYYKSNNSWIFLDESSVKAATNPWGIKQSILVPIGYKNITNLNFRALKIGDVDGVLVDD